MPNGRRFSLAAVCGILNIARKDKIQFNLPDIFREETFDNDAYLFLERLLLNISWQAKEPRIIGKINKSVGRYNKKNASVPAEIKLDQNDVSESSLKRRETSSPINSYVWAIIAKRAMQNGCILDFNNIAVKVALNIFLRSIITNIADNTATISLTEQELQQVFLNFIGQLCDPTVDQLLSAEAIHNFLYLGYKTVEQQAQKLTGDTIAVNFAPSLCEGLEIGDIIFGKKIPPVEKSKSGEIRWVADENKKEYLLFHKLTAAWMRHEIFSQPFTPDYYQAYRQNTERFKAELDRLKNIERLLLTASIPDVERMIEPMSKINLLDILDNSEASSSNKHTSSSMRGKKKSRLLLPRLPSILTLNSRSIEKGITPKETDKGKGATSVSKTSTKSTYFSQEECTISDSYTNGSSSSRTTARIREKKELLEEKQSSLFPISLQLVAPAECALEIGTESQDPTQVPCYVTFIPLHMLKSSSPSAKPVISDNNKDKVFHYSNGMGLKSKGKC